ncbi:MAG: hypothetical protein NTX61_11875 [Bacteroidetes bacterium]|nr:hypothetical protein [Bacteroidota bacterium]
MKTTKIFSALSIAMIVFGLSAFATKPSSENTRERGLIRYQVNINIPANLSVSNLQLLVMVKDGSNRLVAPPQPFHFGTLSYTFTEKVRVVGPVNDTRIAMLVLSNAGGRAILLYNNTDTKSGAFEPDHLYRFLIFPEIGDNY